MITDSDVQIKLDIFKQLIGELEPEFNINSGSFHDMVLYPAAILAAYRQKEIAAGLNSLSIDYLLNYPDNVDEITLDKFAKNWAVLRNNGSHSKGEVSVYLDKAIPIAIPYNFELYTSKATFRVNQPYLIKISNVNNVNDRQLQQINSKLWVFTIPVTALAVGEDGNLIKSTRLRSKINLSPHVINILAADHFTGGKDKETNEQLVKRLVYIRSKETK